MQTASDRLAREADALVSDESRKSTFDASRQLSAKEGEAGSGATVFDRARSKGGSTLPDSSRASAARKHTSKDSFQALDTKDALRGRVRFEHQKAALANAGAKLTDEATEGDAHARDVQGYARTAARTGKKVKNTFFDSAKQVASMQATSTASASHRSSVPGLSTPKDAQRTLKAAQRTKRMQEHAQMTRSARRPGVSIFKGSTAHRSSAAKLTKAKAAAGKGVGAKVGIPVLVTFGVILLIALVISACMVLSSILADANSEQEIFGLEGNASIVAFFLLDQGLDPLHIAAIMGNMYAESRYDPDAIEAGEPYEGRGLLQWSWWGSLTNPDRRQQLYIYTGFAGCESGEASKSNNQGSWTDIQKQLEFMWAEMTREGVAVPYTNGQWRRGSSMSAFQSLDDLDAATTYFGVNFLRHSASANRDRQYTEAQRIYAILALRTSIGSGEFVWPTPGFYNVTSPFGYRIHPIWGDVSFHSGIDIAGNGIHGTLVVAAGEGRVIFRGWMGGYGNTVVIDHGEGLTTLYAHLNGFTPSGERVLAGQPIGFVGTTGASTGPHLHFEVQIDRRPVDPMTFLRRG